MHTINCLLLRASCDASRDQPPPISDAPDERLTGFFVAGLSLILLTAVAGCAILEDAAGDELTTTAAVGSVVFVSDLPFTTVANGWGPVELDRAVGDLAGGDGGALVLNGVTYSKGLGAHANSEIRIALNAQYATFSADVGVDDSAGPNGSVRFQVWADGNLFYDSGNMGGEWGTQTINVSVAGVNELTLIASDAGDGIGWDHADWANAQLIPAGGSDNPGIAESPNGTTIPPASEIIDSNGTVWTVSGGYSYQNGVADGGANINKLLYYNRAIYADTTSYGWWMAVPGGWVQSGDPYGDGDAAALGGCGNCDGVDALRAFETFMNRPVDYVLVWGWAQTAGDLMYAFHYLDEMWPGNYKLHYSVPMILSSGTFAAVYNGSLDSVYRDVAQTIASRDPNGIIRIGHEMNGNWYDWSIDSPAGTSGEYVLCYQRLVDIFRSVSPNFKFVWNPGAGKWAGIDSLPSYPGDAYVDYVSFDMYEDAAWAVVSPTDRWNHFLENDGRGLNWLAEFAAQHGKQIAFDEWGSAIDDGVFITNMHNWITTHNVAYHMYWNSDASFAGSFATNPVNGATYKQLFGR